MSDKMRTDFIWANEGGLGLTLRHAESDALVVEITDHEDGAIASVTIAGWRRDRIMAMARRDDAAAQSPTPPGGGQDDGAREAWILAERVRRDHKRSIAPDLVGLLSGDAVYGALCQAADDLYEALLKSESGLEKDNG